MEKGQLLLENLSWILGKIVKMFKMLFKNYILVLGLGKKFGRSVNNFERSGKKFRDLVRPLSVHTYQQQKLNSKSQKKLQM